MISVAEADVTISCAIFKLQSLKIRASDQGPVYHFSLFLFSIFLVLFFYFLMLLLLHHIIFFIFIIIIIIIIYVIAKSISSISNLHTIISQTASHWRVGCSVGGFDLLSREVYVMHGGWDQARLDGHDTPCISLSILKCKCSGHLEKKLEETSQEKSINDNNVLDLKLNNISIKPTHAVFKDLKDYLSDKMHFIASNCGKDSVKLDWCTSIGVDRVSMEVDLSADSTMSLVVDNLHSESFGDQVSLLL